MSISQPLDPPPETRRPAPGEERSRERTPTGPGERRRRGLARAVLAAGALGLVRLALLWLPAGPGGPWPAVAGELRHALAGVLAVALVCAAGGALRGIPARVAVGVLLFAALVGVPAHVPFGDAAGAVAGRPVQAAVAVFAALAGAMFLCPRRDEEPGAPPRGSVLLGAFGLAVALATGPLAWRALERSLPRQAGERTVLSLLDERMLDVREQDPERPVRVTTFATDNLTQFDSGSLPALEVSPPAEVRIEIPPTVPGAVLRLAAGVAEGSYVSDARTTVTLEASFESQPAVTANLTTWSRATAARRTWKRAEIPVGEGGTLVLRSSFDGPEGESPRAGFGLLEVVRPVSGHRTLATRRSPSVVLVVVDTLRADRLGVYGNRRPASPALDRLAARGTLFDTAFAAASWTWPSTTSILTSLSPPEHGVTDPTACYLSDGLVTLAEVFQDHGFTTAAFSANPLVSAGKNFDKGFETFAEYRWDPAPAVVDDVGRWLARMGRYRFFLYLHLIDPHGPYEPDDDLARAFATRRPRHYSATAHKRLVDDVRLGRDADLDQLERNAAYLSSLYDGEVATADRALARLLDRLDELGLADTTVVAVTSDHGEEFLEHGMMGHGRQVHRESVRVPLILAGPGVPRGQRVEVPVENRFLGPTLLALAGVEPRDNLSGRPNLLDAADVEACSDEPIFFSCALGWWPGEGARPLLAVRGDGRFLIWSPAPGDGDGGRELTALFDLERDPDARHDVAAERPEEVARLRARIEAWVDAGRAVRPNVFDGGAEVRAMLEDLGYLDSEPDGE